MALAGGIFPHAGPGGLQGFGEFSVQDFLNQGKTMVEALIAFANQNKPGGGGGGQTTTVKFLYNKDGTSTNGGPKLPDPPKGKEYDVEGKLVDADTGIFGIPAPYAIGFGLLGVLLLSKNFRGARTNPGFYGKRRKRGAGRKRRSSRRRSRR